jgi:predicted phage tail protein
MKNVLELKSISGEGGGKGGGSGGSDSADTLQTNEIIKIVHLIGEGEVNLYTGDGQSIFLNNTPLQNSDLTYNFGGYDQTNDTTTIYTGGGSTYFEWRNGAPSQSPMTNPAFPSASAIFTVNAQVLGGTSSPLIAPAPVPYSVTGANVDYCKVAINFPNGLVNVDGNGNIIGDSVNLAIDVKPRTSGTWTNVITRYVNDKSSNSAAIQFQVTNPNPGSLWDLRVRRLTQDNSTAVRKNQFYLLTVEEVQQITLPYNGIAYCGLALDAATIGGDNASIPTMSFLVQRGPIAIPSNFNPATNTFTGSWDGTFTTGVTDDPAWVLYDMITNQQYGLYLYGIDPATVDKYSFYNASVFNNALVSDGAGGTQPRFTFNAPIQNRQDVFTSLTQVATMMNASLSVINGLITLYQDRPTSPKYLINKSRVIASDAQNPIYFKYSSNQLTQRTTAVNVTYVNSTNIQYLPTTVAVKDATMEAKYGYQSADLAAFGATNYGQALRSGRYWLYENLYNTQTVEFDMGLEGFLCQPDDVFLLFDDDYAGRALAGRTVSATTNTITLDAPVIIDSGVTTTIWILLQDGVTFESHTVTNSPGTYSTLSIADTFSTVPAQYTPFGVVSSISPRTFKIKDIKIDNATKIVTVTARQYSNANYSYVEGTYTAPTAIYTQPVVGAPTIPANPTATPAQFISVIDGTLQRSVIISWDRPVQNNIGHVIKWRKDNGPYTTTPQFATNSYEIPGNLLAGEYDFLIYAVSLTGQYSAPATISYTLNTSGGAGSAVLSEITNLYVVGTAGTAWSGVDCAFQWTNPAANQGLLKDFVVTIKNTGGTTLRTIVADPVNGGASQNYIYHFADNLADGLNRSIVVTVQGRDSQNNTTTGITATLTNSAPAVPSNIAASPGLQSAIVTWTPSTGTAVSGYLVWYSATAGFTPSSSNVVDCGNTAIASINGLIKNTTYYFRVAAYDVFGKALDGTGLNVSSQLSFATPSSIGIASGATLPTSGMIAGDTFFLTTTNTLYKYTGSAWVAVGIQQGSSLPVSGMSTGDVFFLTTDNKLYRYTGSAWTKAVDGGDITANTITANSIVAGTITSAQIAASTITGSNIVAGTITGSLIAAATIHASNIVAGTLTATQIAAGTITTTQIAAGTITGTNISGGTITGSLIAGSTITGTNIAGSTITAGNIAAGTITSSQIAANTITAGNMSVGTLSAIAANMGTITAGTIIFDNGVYMKVQGLGFGASSDLVTWYGPHQASIASCTKANAINYEATDGTSLFSGAVATNTSTTGLNGYFKHPPDASGRVFIDQWGLFTQSASSPNTVPFTIPFPNACLNVTGSPYGASETYDIYGFTTTGFNLHFGAASQQFIWRAFGY